MVPKRLGEPSQGCNGLTKVLKCRPRMVARVGPDARSRLRGEGWEAWRDDEGFLWVRDTQPMHAIAASAATDALTSLLSQGPVLGLIVDERRYSGEDTPAARDMYLAFLRANPLLPVAVVTTHATTARAAFDLRAASGRDHLQVFRSLAAARAWLRGLAPSRAG